MKKHLSLILVLILAVAFTACGSSDTPAPADTDANTNTDSDTDTNTDDAPAATDAGSFPADKALKIIVPYDAGGGVDISARLLAASADETLGQRLDVVCMSASNGQEGIQYVYDQPTDGYTLLASDYGPLVSPVLQGEVDYYDLDEWIPIVEINRVNPTFFVREDSPFETMEQLIQEGIDNPGTVSVAHGRHLSIPHLPLILLEDQSGAKFSHVPTSGGAEALTFVLGGNVDVGGSVPSTVASGVLSGDLRALAVASDERDGMFPDTPTLQELGYDVVMPSWYMVFVKKGTPEDVIRTLESAFQEALHSEDAQKRAEDAAIEITALGAADALELYNSMNKDIQAVLDLAN